jgi:hypothetical protein
MTGGANILTIRAGSGESAEKPSIKGLKRKKAINLFFEFSTFKDNGTNRLTCELLLLARHRRHYGWMEHTLYAI